MAESKRDKGYPLTPSWQVALHFLLILLGIAAVSVVLDLLFL